MKQILMITVAIMFAIVTNGQVKSIFKTKEVKIAPLNTVKGTNELISVQDSSKHFDYNGTDDIWEADSKINVLTRYADGKAKTQQHSDTATANWKKIYLEEFSYQNGNNIDTWLIKPWDANILNWADTALYNNLTGSFLGNEPIYEEVYVQKNRDDATNQYTGGFRFDISLHNDSLYQDFVSRSWNNVNNTWGEYAERSDFTYDDDDNMLTHIEKNWDNTTNLWVNFQKELYAYSNGNKIQYVKQEWNVTEWKNKEKETYVYDTNNNMTEYVEYDWNTSTNQWDNETQKIYVYDSNNKVEYIYKTWNTTTGLWENQIRYTYTYENNNITHNVTYVWDEANMEWDSSSQNIYTYNTNTDITEKRYQNWDNVASDWKNSYRYVYEYNANFDQTLYLYQDWNSTDGDWDNNYQIITEYNSNNDITLAKDQNWNSTDGDWDNDYQSIYEYDTNNNLIRETEQSWNSTDDVWDNDSKDEYYWSEFNATGVKTIQDDFRIYPDPTNGIVNVVNSKNNLRSVKITNVIGKVVYSNESLYMKKESINLKQFGNGIYLIEAKTVNGEKLTSKIIVE